MAQLVKVANTEDVPEGHCIAVEAAGRNVALFHVNGKYFAIDGTCTHRGGPLAEGELNGNVVTCPWHGANFDVTSGEALSPPAPSGVTCYQVQVDGSEVKIEVPWRACKWAAGVRIDDKPYLVTGAGVDGHRARLCSCAKKAKVVGEIEGDKFVARSFELLP